MNDTLPSWHDTPTKQAILDFVAAVTDETGPGYVPPAERIAVFDNDGTLWCEKPMVIQMDFILRKLVAQAKDDPALRTRQPWQVAWERDFAWFSDAMTQHYLGDDSAMRVVLSGILALSDGQAVEQVESDARAFVDNERHPTLGLAYRDCVYQPMLELLRYLEANGFSNTIVSGGGPSLPALRLLVVHDDGEREFEYSAGAEKALSTTQSQGWTAVSMQRDWRQIFPG